MTVMPGYDVHSSPVLVGRARECAVIDRLIGAAARGDSGVLVVRGEAGMGKTALLGYAAARATEMRVLRATGVEAEHDLAFAGLHGLLWPIIDELQSLPEPQRGALAAALGLAAGEGRDRFLASVGALTLLAAAAEAHTDSVPHRRRTVAGSLRPRMRWSSPRGGSSPRAS